MTTETELCPHCQENDVEIDDFGWYGCRRCFNDDPAARHHIREAQDREDIMFGYEQEGD